MERINKLLCDPGFRDCLEKNRECENDRIYCRHDLAHALDVARIAYILSLEEQSGLEKETVYAAALVHDLGRWQEYVSGIRHDEAGPVLAEPLLRQSGFSDGELAIILQAVGDHRHSDTTVPLSALLYRADKLSRNCPCCAAIGTCKRFQHGETPFLRY